MIRWDVSPEIFRLGPLALRWYSLGFMLSFFLGYLIFKWIYQREKKPLESLDSLFVYMFFGTLIGARLGHCLFYDPGYYLSHPLEILKVWEGGLASHGAAIGITIALYLYSSKHKDQPFLWILDRIAIVVALAGFFIRLGNLFNSEILGKPAHVPWAFVFVRVDNIPRHPVQLYEALAYLLIFILLFWLYRNKQAGTREGYLIGMFFITVFGVRFFLEFFKERQAAFRLPVDLTMGQLLSIPFVLLGIYLLVRALKKPPQPES